MELWALLNFQNCALNDDGDSFYLVAEAAGLETNIKI